MTDEAPETPDEVTACPHPAEDITDRTVGRVAVQTCGRCGEQWAVEP